MAAIRPKIIAVDFDGTLCIGDHGRDYIGPPNWPVINYIKQQQICGAYIILWTCRTGKALKNAIECCKQYGIIFNAVNDNVQETYDECVRMGWEVPRKVLADEYIDDRAINTINFI